MRDRTVFPFTSKKRVFRLELWQVLVIGISAGISVIFAPFYILPIIIVLIALVSIFINPFIGIMLYVMSFPLPQGTYVAQAFLGISVISFIFCFFSKKGNIGFSSQLIWIILGMYFLGVLPIFFIDGVLERYIEFPRDPLVFVGYSITSLVLIGILDSKQKISIIAILLAIIAIVIGFVCFIQVFFPSIQIRVGPATVIEYFNIRGTDPSTISDSKTTETARRAVSFFADGPFTAFVLQTISFICFSMLWLPITTKQKIFWSFASLCCIFGIIASLSRTAWFTFFVLSLYYFLFKKKIKLKYCLLTVVIVGVVFLSMYDYIMLRFEQSIHTYKYHSVTEIPDVKTGIAEIKRIIKNPFIGTGLGVFNEFEGINNYLTEQGVVLYRDAFNPEKSLRGFIDFGDFTTLGAQLGIGGIILYFMLIIFVWKNLTQIEQKHKDNPFFFNLAVGLKGSFLGILLFAIISNATNNKYFWFIVSMSIALNFIAQKEDHNEEGKDKNPDFVT